MPRSIGKKGASSGGSEVITEAAGPKNAKVKKSRSGKKKKAEAEETEKRKVGPRFRLFAGQRGDKLLHRNGITSAQSDARKLLDAIAVTMTQDIVETALIYMTGAFSKAKTLLPLHVTGALKIHSSVDMLNTDDKKKVKKKAKKEKEGEEVADE
jgi:hypothetical protein